MSAEIIGHLHSINASNGGVPKLPRTSGHIRTSGLEGDAQRDLRYHGGADRAVSLYSFDLIQALQAEGHAITPGSAGENLTLAGVDWRAMTPGARLEIGDVVIELTQPASPCTNIAGSFHNGSIVRISERKNPGWSRFYARVLKEGLVSVGDTVRFVTQC